ncbi:fimbrial biogenesis chaperone [Pandoraea fibrosis]|uniref:Putative fimbrial chaperone EcpB n=1 Tax=Pandoraea fibrosis TaxID=1891094 RepID=A0A5E4VFQ4_9BURK|nr:molecular chaperone [Pandoraea fibrosis]VVE10936.1 putative fimbrial chaperone EcpB [Pandoraea fibrosis]
MKARLLISTLVGLLLGMPVCANAAAPSINIGTMFDYLGGGNSSLLKQIRNTGDATAFVRVEVVEIQIKGDGTQVEVPIDPALLSKPDGQGLVASPARLIVPANGMQAVRLLYRGNRDSERYYRVRFVPVVPKAKDDFVLNNDEIKTYEDSLSAGLNVLTGFGAMVIVRPAEERYATSVRKEGKDYVVENSGNSIIAVESYRTCKGPGTECEQPTTYHVRPGKNKTLTCDQGMVCEFDLLEGKTRTRKRIILESVETV